MKTTFTFLVLTVWLGLIVPLKAGLTVASLHPVLTDIAKQVGGENLSVIPLLKPGDDPHDFAPSASDIRKMREARLILASGKGLEPYLEKLKDSLTSSQTIFDVGRDLPSITISHDSELFVCCPHHSEGSIDPHWWHSVKNVQRAVKILAKELAKVDPSNAAHYETSAKAYNKRLKALDKWAKKEITRVPRKDRKLATAHAAYTYFCKDYGFKSMPVQGLTKEKEAPSQYLAETIAHLKEYRVRAVFPEALANPKVLQEMVRGTGARIGGRLFGDFTGNSEVTTYEAMFRHNVKTIVEGLAPPRE